jgi:hypothetical protein
VDTDRPASQHRATAPAGAAPGWLWALGGVASLALAAVVAFAGLAWVGSTMAGSRAGEPPAPASRTGSPGAGQEAGAPATTPAAAGPEVGFAVWERNEDGRPVRWDPCRPIEVVLSTDGAPDRSVADLEEALARLAAVSELELVLLGTTDERPAAARSPYQPERYGDRWAPILVAWARPGEADLPLRTTDRGVAIPIAGGPPGDRTFLTAQVVLNRDRTDLVPGFDDRADAWGSTLLHELLHALGLAHVDDPDQLMAVYPGTGPVQFGEGDLAGLAAIGPAGGCRPTPGPGPVTVAPPAGMRPVAP